MHELERLLQHVLRTSQAPPNSTPKGTAGLNATLPLSGLAPPANDSFQVRIAPYKTVSGGMYSCSHASNGNDMQVTAEVAPEETIRPLPKSLSMSATRVIMHQIVLPSEVDIMGICFGGQVDCPPEISKRNTTQGHSSRPECSCLTEICTETAVLISSPLDGGGQGLEVGSPTAGAELDRHLRRPRCKVGGRRALRDSQRRQRAFPQPLPPWICLHCRCHGQPHLPVLHGGMVV